MPASPCFPTAALAFVLSAGPAVIAAQTPIPGAAQGVPAPAAEPEPDSATLALWQSAMDGNLAEVRTALTNKATVNASTPSKMTALGIAALYGHAEIARVLIAAGANVGADQDGESALMVAAHQGHTAIVTVLLEAGADWRMKDRDGMTALMAAASANRAGVVQALLAKGAEVNAVSAGGASALTAAAFGGHVEAAEALLAGGADVNIRDSAGRTPLMAAALGGNVPLARTLIGKNADLEATDTGGSTALTYAAVNGHAEFIDVLDKAGLKKGADLALAFAVRACHPAVVERFLASGTPLTGTIDGVPLLVLAAGGNCGDVMTALLDRGVDVNIADPAGTTALMTAAGQGFVPMVEMLLARGADMERTNKNQQTAWLMAALGDQREVVEILRAHRARTNPAANEPR
jgi:ankyrin repeat protein